DRVLRRQHQERGRQGESLLADRHLPFLHCLQQRGLHLRRRTVDLVGQDEIREDGAELGIKGAGVLVVDAGADQVRGDQVGRELDSLELTVDDPGGGFNRQRLGQSGYPLDQHMAACQERDQNPLQHQVLTDDDLLDLDQNLAHCGRRLQKVSTGTLTPPPPPPTLAASYTWAKTRSSSRAVTRTFPYPVPPTARRPDRLTARPRVCQSVLHCRPSRTSRASASAGPIDPAG